MITEINSVPYTIGFVGLDYAIAYKRQAAAIQNGTGAFVTPSPVALQRAEVAALRVGMPVDFRIDFPARPTITGAYPIAAFSYLLVHRNLRRLPGTNLAARREIKNFLIWTVSCRGGQVFVGQILNPGASLCGPGPTCAPGSCSAPIRTAVGAAIRALVRSLIV
jgi:ABC-type phosphate transport system substrate-binding protein